VLAEGRREADKQERGREAEHVCAWCNSWHIMAATPGSMYNDMRWHTGVCDGRGERGARFLRRRARAMHLPAPCGRSAWVGRGGGRQHSPHLPSHSNPSLRSAAVVSCGGRVELALIGDQRLAAGATRKNQTARDIPRFMKGTLVLLGAQYPVCECAGKGQGCVPLSSSWPCCPA